MDCCNKTQPFRLAYGLVSPFGFMIQLIIVSDAIDHIFANTLAVTFWSRLWSSGHRIHLPHHCSWGHRSFQVVSYKPLSNIKEYMADAG